MPTRPPHRGFGSSDNKPHFLYGLGPITTVLSHLLVAVFCLQNYPCSLNQRCYRVDRDKEGTSPTPKPKKKSEKKAQENVEG